MEYGLALTLLAISTERSRPHLERHLHEAEQKLQQQWRGMLMSRLRKGELDETTRELLADQLKHLTVNEDSGAPRTEQRSQHRERETDREP